MASSNIHAQHLEVTVAGCNIFSESNRSRPLYVGLQYGAHNRITVPNHDGGMDTTFSNKFDFPLIEGETELKFVVWKNIDNDFLYDDFLGSGRVQLHNVISEGHEESSYPFQKGNHGNNAGELKLALRCKRTHSHSESLSKDRYPSSLHQSLSYPPPTSYYQQPSYFSPPPPPTTYFSPPPPTYFSPPPPTYFSPPSPHPYTTLPPSHYPQPLYLVPPSYQSPPYVVPPSQPPPPPRTSFSILPLAVIASLTSIGESMFQFFGG